MLMRVICHFLQAIPENYKLVECPRKDNSGYGGVGIIFKDSLSVSRCQCLNFQSIEHLIICVDLSHEHLLFGLVYRPPPSVNNQQCNGTFLKEVDEF